MKVHVEFFSILPDRVGVGHAALDLAEGADYGDLPTQIRNQYGDHMPEPLWNRQRGEFTHQIFALRSG